LRSWTLHEAVGKAEDAQFGRLWLAAKNVAFWPMMVDNRSQADVRFRAETNFGGATD
jgi:hypothetical protein